MPSPRMVLCPLRDTGRLVADLMFAVRYVGLPFLPRPTPEKLVENFPGPSQQSDWGMVPRSFDKMATSWGLYRPGLQP